MLFPVEFAHLKNRYPQRLTVHRLLESEAGLPTENALRALINSSEDCEAFRSLTANPFDEAPERRHTPPSTVTDDQPVTVTVEIDGKQHSFDWPRNAVLLDVLLDMGIDAPFVCREGSCGGCAYFLTDGQVEMRANDTLDDYELARGVRLACQSVPVSDSVALMFDA